jgi:hypothetical protein
VLTSGLNESIHCDFTADGVGSGTFLGWGIFSMRKYLGAALGAAVLCATAIPGAAMAATSPGAGRAIIVTPFSFIQVDDLVFSTIVPGGSAGTVTIDAVTGSRTSAGGVAALGGSTAQRARFVGAGSENQTVSLTLSAPPTLSDGGSNTMTMSSLDLDGPNTRTIGPDLAFDVYVGGTLAVGANQAPGFYSGTFTLTVEYN